MATTITIKNQASAAIARVSAAVSGARLNPQIGAAEVLLFKRHFLGLPPNKQGFPSTHFWADAARSTNFRLDPSGPVISINKQGIRQRRYGGQILPTGGRKYLTIPANAEAYGKRAGEFHNLRIAKLGGRLALVENQASEVSISKADKKGNRTVTWTASRTGLVPFFWLVKAVNQQPDPSILPSDQEISDVALAEANAAVDRAKRKSA